MVLTVLGLLQTCNGCYIGVCVGLLTVEVRVSLTLSPVLEILLFLLGCLAQPLYEGLCLILSLGSLLFFEETEK